MCHICPIGPVFPSGAVALRGAVVLRGAVLLNSRCITVARPGMAGQFGNVTLLNWASCMTVWNSNVFKFNSILGE
ncbi:hypothetical protein Enr13x_48110 [Stieleria neptunia]|uniref:Uncharacterized protein n=1 Tax=Stieleria neptunia TaxID=2527979 RepID=A0A518HVQ6_9BACT|nr:hypothetical protein Enr13x_48110 [Stieleria neptunia]